MSWTQRLHGDNALGLSDTDATLTRYAPSRWQVGLDDVIEVAGAGRVRHRTALADAQPTVELGAGGWLLGAGGAAAPDVRGYRSGALEFIVDDGAAGPISAIVLGTLGVLKNSAATNTTVDILTVTSKSTGTPLAGFGPRFRAKAEITDGNDLELGGLSWSWNSLAVGAETSVMRLQTRSSAAVIDRWELSNLELYPYADAGQNLGKTSRRINNVVALHYQYSSAGWANPTTDLSNKYLAFGLGNATPLSWRLFFTGDKVAQVDDGAGGPATLLVVGQLKTQGRQETVVSTAVTPYVLDAVTENLFVDSTVGAMAVSIGSAVTYPGKEIKLFTTTVTANQITVTPVAGLINGAATLVIPVGLSVVTFKSDGANWWASRSLIP